jgi:hypothetical protein
MQVVARTPATAMMREYWTATGVDAGCHSTGGCSPTDGRWTQYFDAHCKAPTNHYVFLRDLSGLTDFTEYALSSHLSGSGAWINSRDGVTRMSYGGCDMTFAGISIIGSEHRGRLGSPSFPSGWNLNMNINYWGISRLVAGGAWSSWADGPYKGVLAGNPHAPHCGGTVHAGTPLGTVIEGWGSC